MVQNASTSHRHLVLYLVILQPRILPCIISLFVDWRIISFNMGRYCTILGGQTFPRYQHQPSDHHNSCLLITQKVGDIILLTSSLLGSKYTAD